MLFVMLLVYTDNSFICSHCLGQIPVSETMLLGVHQMGLEMGV